MTTIPNILTFSRVLSIPVIVGTFYIPFPLGIWITFGVFCAAALTDFLDGWLARHLDQITRFGQIFDPIADKLLVATTLILLLADSRISEVAVVTILTREIFVAGIRESLAKNISIPVSKLSKWKTAGQLIAIAVLLLSPAVSNEENNPLQLTGESLLWVVAIITWITALPYMKTAHQNLSKKLKNNHQISVNGKDIND
tara:strand:- start:927 stop:1523 length:597 start_codon:yes stop_codon:yes gene_type:complete